MRKRTCFATALYALLLLTAPGSTETAHAAVGGGKPVVYVIPVEGMIEPALLYVIRRGVNEAKSRGAAALILDMDTPGGTLNAASEIVRTMQSLDLPTYTLVRKDAFSAGAIIALSTRHIYMTPGSVIGDAMPIMISPMGGVQELPEAVQEKSVSAVAALIRAAAQASGHDPQLAEAMVRREIEYKIGEDVIAKEGQLLTLTNVEAERKVGPDHRPLLSAGTVKDLPALLETLGLGEAEVVRLQVTSAERVARFIAALAPLFLMAGLLGIYIEIKTPGFGLPGILGATALALFFWGHHIAGLAGMEEMLFFLAGLALILVEIFILPGFGVAGLLGIVIMFGALLMAMVQRLPAGPTSLTMPDLQEPIVKLSLAIVGTGLIAIVIARMLPHSRLASPLVLAQENSSAAGYAASAPTTALIGREGRALTALRPAGAARFDEDRLDVVTAGQFVEAGTAVRIVSTEGHRVVVAPLPSPSVTQEI